MSSSEEKLQDDILSERDISNEERMFPEEFQDSDNANDRKLKKRREFYLGKVLSRALNDRITYLRIKRTITIIIPREYVSRECSCQDIASNYLSGLEPIKNDYNLQKYCFYAFKLYHLVIILVK